MSQSDSTGDCDSLEIASNPSQSKATSSDWAEPHLLEGDLLEGDSATQAVVRRPMNWSLLVWFGALLIVIPAGALRVFQARTDSTLLYGWVPAISIGVAAWLTYRRWDRTARVTRGAVAYMLLLACLLLTLFGALNRNDWCLAAGFAVFATAFWASNNAKHSNNSGAKHSQVKNADLPSSPKVQPQDWSASRLLPIWPALLGFVNVPPEWMLTLQTLYVSQVRFLASALLSFLKIPAVAMDNVIKLPSETILLSQPGGAWLSLSLALLLVGCYSAISSRKQIEVGVNLLLALATFPLMLVLCIGCRGVAAYKYQMDSTSGTIGGWIDLAVLGVAILFFLSAERLLRGIIFPIAPKFFPDRGSPLISAWNLLTQSEQLSQRSEYQRTESQRTELVDDAEVGGSFGTELNRSNAERSRSWFLGASAIGAASLVLAFASWQTFVKTNPFADAVSDTLRTATPEQFAEILGHEAAPFIVQNPARGRLDIWSSPSAIRNLELVVVDGVLVADELLRLSKARGWKSSSDFMAVPASDMVQVQTFSSDEHLVSQIAYLDASGDVSKAPAGQTGYVTLHLISRFRQPPTADELAVLAAKFAKALATNRG